MDITAVLDTVEANLDAARERWFSLLRIPSVSAQPAHAADCHTAAEWLRDQLAGIGFSAGIRATAGQPVVLAHHPGPAQARATARRICCSTAITTSSRPSRSSSGPIRRSSRRWSTGRTASASMPAARWTTRAR